MDVVCKVALQAKNSHKTHRSDYSDSRSFSTLNLVIGTVLTCISFLTNATLISGNYGNGVDNLTIDTTTGLEWLDLQESMYPQDSNRIFPLTYNEVANELQDGGQFEGFRFATLNELESLLFGSAAISLTSPGRDASIGALIDLVSDNFNESHGLGTRYYATGYFDYLGDVGLASLEVTEFAGNHFDGKISFIDNANPDLHSNYDYFASWLVRDSVAVPEPGTLSFSLFLLFAGLVAGLKLSTNKLA
ncbi:MAG: hypothetical protein SV765_07060 [Pseudomonadota bacterium]|nr:hypothetical protein [Pseudomonadota bacterium]